MYNEHTWKNCPRAENKKKHCEGNLGVKWTAPTYMNHTTLIVFVKKQIVKYYIINDMTICLN